MHESRVRSSSFTASLPTVVPAGPPPARMRASSMTDLDLSQQSPGMKLFLPTAKQDAKLKAKIGRRRAPLFEHAPHLVPPAPLPSVRPTEHQLAIQKPSRGVGGWEAFKKPWSLPKGLSKKLNRRGNWKKRRGLAVGHADRLDPELPHSHKRFSHIPTNDSHALVFRGLHGVRHDRFRTRVDGTKAIGSTQGIVGTAHSTDMVAHTRDPFFATGVANQKGTVYASVIPPGYGLDLEKYQRSAFGGPVDYATAPQGNLSYEVTTGVTHPEWVVGHKSYDEADGHFVFTHNPRFNPAFMDHLNKEQKARLEHWRKMGDPTESGFDLEPLTFAEGKALLQRQRFDPSNPYRLGPGPVIPYHQDQIIESPGLRRREPRKRSKSVDLSAATLLPEMRIGRRASFEALLPPPSREPEFRFRSASVGGHVVDPVELPAPIHPAPPRAGGRRFSMI